METRYPQGHRTVARRKCELINSDMGDPETIQERPTFPLFRELANFPRTHIKTSIRTTFIPLSLDAWRYERINSMIDTTHNAITQAMNHTTNGTQSPSSLKYIFLPA